MSIDDKTEEAAYAAVSAVCQLIWPEQRERILKRIVVGIMIFMKWNIVELKQGDDNEQERPH